MPPKRHPKPSPVVVSTPIKPVTQNYQGYNSDEEDDGREICEYDERCYRKNPTHFTKYRHPKKKAMEQSNQSNLLKRVDSPSVLKRTFTNEKLESTIRQELETYKVVLKSLLCGTTTISSENKKMLRKLRTDQGIKKQEHDLVIAQFGWTPDEYEDGERQIPDVEIDGEEVVLLDSKGFKIFTITKHQKKTPKEESVWSKAASQFYQTMSTAQSNFSILSVSLVVNTRTINEYNTKKAQFIAQHGEAKEEWGFHGSSDYSIDAIAKDGFKHPDDLGTHTNSGQVALLDSGYFGKGIYFSMYSDYALYYSAERGSNRILLCKLLTGKVFQCKNRMDGEGLKKGFDSHYSPKGNEIILFKDNQVLPRYIIEFEERDAEERDQEY